MAYAGAEFATKVIRAIKGEKGIVAPSYVSLEADTAGGSALAKELDTQIAFFSSNVELGVRFLCLVIQTGNLTDYCSTSSLKELLRSILSAKLLRLNRLSSRLPFRS